MDLPASLDALLANPDVRAWLAVGLRLLVILVVTAMALRLVGRAVDALLRLLFDRETREGTARELSALEVGKRKETLRSLSSGTLRLLVIVIGSLMALQTLDVDVGPAVAGLGIAGIALGFGAQSLVRDYLAGAYILIENQFGRGDVVRIAEVTGTVEDFTLRRTTLRDLDGTVHTVPNGLIGVASNLTRVWARINLDLTLPADVDLQRVTELVDEIGRTLAADAGWKQRVLEAPRVERIEALGPSGVTLKVLGSVRAADRWAASSEMRRRVASALAANGVRLGGS